MIEAPPIHSQQIAPDDRLIGLDALLRGAAFAPLQGTGFIRVTGEDRVRWLNGMVTNSIQALKPGDGCYCFFLSAQGRIQADATAWMLEDSILLETASTQVSGLIALLDRFIIMDDVELHDLGPSHGLQVAGPLAGEALAQQGLAGGSASQLSLIHGAFAGEKIDLMQAHSPLVPRFEVWGAPETIDKLSHTLSEQISVVSADDFDQLRILEGTPLYGADMRDRELPQETAQTRALHFAKGCYLGQEIVERIRSRGNVHRTFTGFLLTGTIPEAGTQLFTQDAPDKAIGEITSARSLQVISAPILAGLGYIRREVLERQQPIHYEGGTAVPVALPFRIPTPQD